MFDQGNIEARARSINNISYVADIYSIGGGVVKNGGEIIVVSQDRAVRIYVQDGGNVQFEGGMISALGSENADVIGIAVNSFESVATLASNTFVKVPNGTIMINEGVTTIFDGAVDCFTGNFVTRSQAVHGMDEAYTDPNTVASLMLWVGSKLFGNYTA